MGRTQLRLVFRARGSKVTAIRLFVVLGAMALLASLAVACGDDGDDSPSGDTGSSGEPVAPGGGLVPRDTFLTYDGKRYELVNMLQESMAPAGEFEEIGSATEADIELKDLRVFSREGDGESVYTYSAATADDPAFWLAWRVVN
jgi:hypothetical protein